MPNTVGVLGRAKAALVWSWLLGGSGEVDPFLVDTSGSEECFGLRGMVRDQVLPAGSGETDGESLVGKMGLWAAR